MIDTLFRRLTGYRLLVLALIMVAAVYWAGLSGSWLFDDYPNIVDNHGVQPANAEFSSLVRAALSSPSSEFKRPLASLSFAANYLASGLDPYAMKLTNLVIHLLNGLLVFLLARKLIEAAWEPALFFRGKDAGDDWTAVGDSSQTLPSPKTGEREKALEGRPEESEETPLPRAEVKKTNFRIDAIAVLVAASWMLLPINLTGVLYVVQRMESMANLFVLLGLLGYVAGRRRMLTSIGARGSMLCLASIVAFTGLGLLAKETAVMLPLYALLIEWVLFRFRRTRITVVTSAMNAAEKPLADLRVVAMFTLLLALPMILGLAWLLPILLKPESWATRDFTLGTRLLSEARIVTDYIAWTLFPTPDALSFYHDDFHISTGLLAPWSTLGSMAGLATLAFLVIKLRSRLPLVSLGLAWFLGCHLLTGTILPLELIYEHRNYFASFGLMLAVIPLLSGPRGQALAFPRHLLLAGLLSCWTLLTAFTAYVWGNPLRLAEDLASRAPESPRAQYELGRTYIIYSHYDPTSPFTQLAYAPLERAAALPESSILPQQALIFMNARMHLPLKDLWWSSMVDKLRAHPPGVQDESSLAALTQCARDRECKLPEQRMRDAFLAALSHPDPTGRLLACYGDYAWNVLADHKLGLDMTIAAIHRSPSEPAYRITAARMFIALGKLKEARDAYEELEKLNIGGRLDESMADLHAQLDSR